MFDRQYFKIRLLPNDGVKGHVLIKMPTNRFFAVELW